MPCGRPSRCLPPITVPIRYSTGELPAYSSTFGGDAVSPYVLLNYTGKQTNQNYIGKATLALSHDFSYLIKDLKLRMQGAYDNVSWKDERRYVMPELYLATGRTNWGANYKDQKAMMLLVPNTRITSGSPVNIILKAH